MSQYNRSQETEETMPVTITKAPFGVTVDCDGQSMAEVYDVVRHITCRYIDRQPEADWIRILFRTVEGWILSMTNPTGEVFLPSWAETMIGRKDIAHWIEELWVVIVKVV